MTFNRSAKVLAFLVVGAVVVLGLAACSSTNTPTTSQTATAAPPLTGTTTPPSIAATVTAPVTTSQSTNTTPTFTPVPASEPPLIQYLPPVSGNATNYTINVGKISDGFYYLTDGKGRTLYYSTNDAKNLSMADGTTLTLWPVFYTANIRVPSSLNASDFGTVVISGGAKQTTFRGWPLYYSIKDYTPGQANGQGTDNAWFTVDPEHFTPPRYYAPQTAWENGKQVQYYDFTVNATAGADGAVHPGSMYILVTSMNGTAPATVPGQQPIVDAVPGQPDYTGLWNIVYVTVPAKYVAGTITSSQQILQDNYSLDRTGKLVDRPIVPPGSLTQTGTPLVQAWYGGHQVYYFDFGSNGPDAMTAYELTTGSDSSGNPVPVPGQYDIITATVDATGYSAFWQLSLVTVPQDYQANTFTSTDNVTSSQDAVTKTDELFNRPLIPGG